MQHSELHLQLLSELARYGHIQTQAYQQLSPPLLSLYLSSNKISSDLAKRAMDVGGVLTGLLKDYRTSCEKYHRPPAAETTRCGERAPVYRYAQTC